MPPKRKSSRTGVGRADSDLSNKQKNLEYEVKIDSLMLVRLVRSHEVLYNSAADGYMDKIYKDKIWERISKALFPNYDRLEPFLQETVCVSVRRRWKALRDAITREIKNHATIENYCRKKENPIISALEFLIPHIKSIHNVKRTDDLSLHEQYSYANEPDENEEDVIDLTEDCDIKPIIKPECIIADDDVYSNPEIFHPNVQLSVDEECSANDPPSQQPSWDQEYCTVAQFKGGEFINQPTTDNENTESSSEEGKVHTRSKGKRPRLDTAEESTEKRAKILQLLSNLEQEEHDEDRMFLLSLVSDLRRVPSAKKMQVKAEIVNAIARANQT